MVKVNKNQVFLVQGQFSSFVNGEQQLAPEIEQIVVVAANDQAAFALLKIKTPAFKPVGHATLQDYEDAASKLRAALKGDNTGWKLIIAPEFVG